MSTVALNMIVKDEFTEVNTILSIAYTAFDELNIVVSDKTTANKLTKEFAKFPKAHIKYRKWTDRFDEARNVALEMTTTDYMFWIDADDSFDFGHIEELVEVADANSIDAIFLPYNYAQDEDGNCTTRHWRERLIKMGRGFTWRGWVHETCLSDEPYSSHKVDVEVVHRTDADHDINSIQRNHEILTKAYEAEKDPRYLHYLGMSYFTFGDYQKCIELLNEYLQVGGSVEDSYRALSVISECAYYLKQPDIALEYASKAMVLRPAYPMAYYLLAQYEADQENWEEALEWCRTALSKPDPKTLSVYDPSARERCILTAAQAEFMQANYNRALAYLRKIPKNRTALSLFEDFQEEADAESFVTLLPKLRKFFRDDHDLWRALCRDMKYDTRLKALRNNVNRPKTWKDDSIVIFCGQGFEEWGPHTLDKGMGGSEEAVIYLSRELAKLGYKVTVYGEVTEPRADYYRKDSMDNVGYLPWKEIDTRDNFNIFVSWRSPQYLETIKAKVKLADIHDVLPTAMMKNYPDVTYLVKSNYHRGLAPDVEDKNIRVIGNGIKKDQFYEDTKKA